MRAKIKVDAIRPGRVQTEFAMANRNGSGRVKQLDPQDVAGVALLACTHSPKSRIIEVQKPVPAATWQNHVLIPPGFPHLTLYPDSRSEKFLVSSGSEIHHASPVGWGLTVETKVQ
jgi:hypothetical protein